MIPDVFIVLGSPSFFATHDRYPTNTSMPASTTPTRIPKTSTADPEDAVVSADDGWEFAHANSSLASVQSSNPSQCKDARMHCLFRHVHSLAIRQARGDLVVRVALRATVGAIVTAGILVVQQRQP